MADFRNDADTVWFYRKNWPDDMLAVLPASSMIAHAHRRRLVTEIRRLAGATPDLFDKYYQDAIERYARFVQHLPASYDHHHAYIGGLLDHALEAVVAAMEHRQGLVLPPESGAETSAREAQRWTWAVFSATLLHDAARPLVDQQIDLYGKRGESLGSWRPWLGDMPDAGACRYRVRFRRDREYRLHEKAALLVVHRLLPDRGLAWISANLALFGYWIASVSNDPEQSGPLGDIVRRGDALSVARSIGENPAAPAAHGAFGKPLHRRLLLALRQLLTSGDLPLNQPGAAGWLIDDDLWLMSKRVVDAIRDSGVEGMPHSNIRVFEILQQHGLITPNGDKAVWKARITSADWSPDQVFALLRMPASIVWPERDRRPLVFTGGIETDEPPGKGDSSNPVHGDPLPNEKKTSTQMAGKAFLAWLKKGVRDGAIDVNKTGAPVHVVNEGVLLVSPVIFQIYAAQPEGENDWLTVQRSFRELGINARTAKKNENVFTYRVRGKRREAVLKGWVMPDTGAIFQGGEVPVNEHLECLPDGHS